MPESDRDKTIEVMIAALDEQFGDTISPLGIRAIASIALTAYESHLQASGMAVVPGWQPIESAPKDGSEILGCFFKDWGDGNVSRYGPWTIAWNGRDWRSSWDGSQVIEYMGDFGTEYKEPDLKPNFWMPIPAASPSGKAVVQEASAEAQSAVANSNPVKEKDDE